MYSKIIFIDAQVEDYQSLIVGVPPEAIVVVLDAQKDGIEQITHCLIRHPFSEIHIVSHGAPGCLFLGNRQLSLDTLKQYTRQLKRWSADSILLYGCNIAAGDAGAEFVEKLHQITRAEIAASTTKIGHITRGGNWELDFTTHRTQVSLAFTNTVVESYTGVLADSIFDANARSVTVVVNDGDGDNNTPTATINISSANNSPVADNETFTIDEDATPVTIDLLDGDTDIDGDTLSIKSINGTDITPGTPQTISVTNGTVNVAADGTVTFTPGPEYPSSVTLRNKQVVKRELPIGKK